MIGFTTFLFLLAETVEGDATNDNNGDTTNDVHGITTRGFIELVDTFLTGLFSLGCCFLSNSCRLFLSGFSSTSISTGSTFVTISENSSEVSVCHLEKVSTFEVFPNWYDPDRDIAWASHHDIELIVIGPLSANHVVVNTLRVTLHRGFHVDNTLIHPLLANAIDDFTLLHGNFLKLTGNTLGKLAPFLLSKTIKIFVIVACFDRTSIVFRTLSTENSWASSLPTFQRLKAVIKWTSLAFFTIRERISHLLFKTVEGGASDSSKLGGDLQLGVSEWRPHYFFHCVFNLLRISCPELFFQIDGSFYRSGIDDVGKFSSDIFLWDTSLKVFEGSHDRYILTVHFFIHFLFNISRVIRH
jgi:hypothetical protein